MKNLCLASILSVAAAGFALAAPAGDDGSKAKAKSGECAAVAKDGDCPATALVAKWEKAAEQLAAMPAEKREALARARETLSASCPVCKEGPASFAFLGRFLGSTVALDGLFLACCEGDSKHEKCDEVPEAVRSAFEQRIAIGAKSNELFAVFARASAPPEKAEVAKTEPAAGASVTVVRPGGAKMTFAEAGKTFESISEEAARLATTWNGIPARAAALPAATKSELFAAMDVVMREVPTCDLAKETISVLAGGLEHLVSLDKTLADHCQATLKEHAVELPAEFAQMKKAAEARTKATAKVAELLRVMHKMMTPEIFQAPPAAGRAGAGQ
ncbi:MAG TPA: hypothetical protein VFI25_02455 [Planctomycetota bacterium]|nr:hypothetical protein [Planctomycetota bacterium]